MRDLELSIHFSTGVAQSSRLKQETRHQSMGTGHWAIELYGAKSVIDAVQDNTESRMSNQVGQEKAKSPESVSPDSPLLDCTGTDSTAQSHTSLFRMLPPSPLPLPSPLQKKSPARCVCECVRVSTATTRLRLGLLEQRMEHFPKLSRFQ